MTHLSLFSGIGGLDLAAEWAGFETVGQCEYADFPTKVLEKHWPDVPRWRDIRTLTAEDFYVRTGMRTVDIISGGFPCQPFSVAGRRKGKEDNRCLWPEFLRVVREIKPRWIFGENVPGILRIAADDVCADLEREGYAVGIFDFEAAAVGAPHRRERIAFVGYAERGGRGGGPWRRTGTQSADGREDVSDADKPGLERRGREVLPECTAEWFTGKSGSPAANASSEQDRRLLERGAQTDTGAVNRFIPNADERGTRHAPRSERPTFQQERQSGECDLSQGDRRDGAVRTVRSASPGLGQPHDGLSGWVACPVDPWAEPWDTIPRVGYKIPNRADKLRALGNAAAPQWAYVIFKAIMEAES